MTGKIEGLDVAGKIPNKPFNVLIIDDISFPRLVLGNFSVAISIYGCYTNIRYEYYFERCVV